MIFTLLILFASQGSLALVPEGMWRNNNNNIAFHATIMNIKLSTEQYNRDNDCCYNLQATIMNNQYIGHVIATKLYYAHAHIREQDNNLVALRVPYTRAQMYTYTESG